MKHKLFAFLLILLVTGSGSAFAQGTIPPTGSDPLEALPKSDFLLPDIGNESIPAIPSRRDAGPAATTPPLANGGFEQGPFVGWSENSNHGWPVVLPSNMLPPTPHSGNWAAWLGGDNAENAYIAQAITIPSSSFLRMFYWIASSDSCGFLDRAEIKLADSIFTMLHELDLCASNNTNGWVPLDLDLSAYGGQTKTLIIEVYTNSQVNSNLFIDDVSLYGTFADVSYDYWAADFIDRLHNAGVTGGCSTNPSLYCIDTPVTRDQIAIFLLRGIYGSSYSPPAPGATTGFVDVPTSYWAAPWIKQLAAEGITGGCATGLYCPTSPVTRAQMAVFLLRSKYGASYSPPAVGASTGFSDVPPDYWAGAWIKQLVAEGITSGCGAGVYCPESPVTRAQMAVFLVRTFNLP